MPEIILHHYERSPFSEKVRLALGIKGLAWRSVEIAAMPPRPLLEPLTGGYRRTPVLQIGADVFCDTTLILPTLERLHPTPTLYPPGSAGLAPALSFAWERLNFVPAVGVLSHFFGGRFSAEMVRDRLEGFLGFDIRPAAMAPLLATHRRHLRAQFAWLEQALADGRPFLFGHSPSALDLSCFHILFMLRKSCPPQAIDEMLGLDATVPWYERLLAIGPGRPVPMVAQEALEIARDAMPLDLGYLGVRGSTGDVAIGTVVRVTPDDNARVPVQGRVAAVGGTEIVIARDDPQAGRVHVHFPRAGFDVEAVVVT